MTKLMIHLIVVGLFVTGCSRGPQDIKLTGTVKPAISPTRDILSKKNIETIKDEFWTYPDEAFCETQEDYYKLFNSSSSWNTRMIIKDKTKIQRVMMALGTVPVEKLKLGEGCFVPEGRLGFIDNKGKTFYTTLNISHGRKEVYLADSVYGEDVYNVFAEVFEIKYIEPDLNFPPKDKSKRR